MESPPPTGFSAPSRWPWLAARCELCGTWPAQPAGSPVCAECLGTFTPHAHRCPTCALPLPTPTGDRSNGSHPPSTISLQPCTACQHAPPPLHRCVAALDYAYPWNQLIHRFKFKGEVAWAQWLAGLMWQAPGTAPLLAATDWWLPIPLSLPRLGERGYNQSWELVKALAPLHAPASLKQKARADWLLKLAHTSAQHDLNRAARLRNLGTAFAIAPHALPHLANAHVLLVDDIMTTGATLHAAAQTLRRGGAASVSALVLARTPAPGEDDGW